MMISEYRSIGRMMRGMGMNIKVSRISGTIKVPKDKKDGMRSWREWNKECMRNRRMNCCDYSTKRRGKKEEVVMERSEKVEESGEKMNEEEMWNWLSYKVPKSVPSMITNELCQMYSISPVVILDCCSEEIIWKMNEYANKNEPMGIFYEREVQGKRMGLLCMISSLIRMGNRVEVKMRVLRRIVTNGMEWKEKTSVVNMEIEEWKYERVEWMDMEDCICELLNELKREDGKFGVFVKWMVENGKQEMGVDLAMNRMGWRVMCEMDERDMSGVKRMMEEAYLMSDVLKKMEWIKSARKRVMVEKEMRVMVEEMMNEKKWKSMEEQVERVWKKKLEGEEEEEWKNLPEVPRLMVKKEWEYLKSVDKKSAEYAHAMTYVEWLVNLPWNIETRDCLNVKKAEEVLNRSHYGMEEVKEKILQLVANASRKGVIESNAWLLVGPPGTGKTTIAKAIAEALGRKYIHISGVVESSDLRGFRRTYVGSMPGKIICEMRRVQSSNPVIVFDEVDKIDDRRTHKPIVPVLLELLSPDQNRCFLDQYMDVPFDMSRVLFICTANVTDTIPLPLMNRLRVIEMRGYSWKEKSRIAKRYMLPKIRSEMGLKRVWLEDEALKWMIEVHSCEEAGVRQLGRKMESLYRKVAVEMMKKNESGEEERVLKVKELWKYLGVPEPKGQSGMIYPKMKSGVVIGLAKNKYGGSTLTIEAVRDGIMSEWGARPRLDLTGNVKETMKESSQIAYNCAKAFMSKYYPENRVILKSWLHLHLPYGAIRKDGPSAGCAMACVLVSLALNRPVRQGICITGELTLTGRVMAVGGVREKVLAASQGGLKYIVLPLKNKWEFESIPEESRGELHAYYVSNFEQVFGVVFDMPLPMK